MECRKSLLALIVVLGCVFTNGWSVQGQTAPTPKTHRVLFALTSGDESDWGVLLGNIQNMLAGFPAGSVEVEVVAYSSGLNLVKKTSSSAEAVENLEAKHVRFTACENSMRAQHVTAADLLAGVEPVPSGIVEVVTKQEQGWTYIKAGH